MTDDPMRLSEEDPDGFEASLIRAARSEAPASTARRAAAAAGALALAGAAPKVASAATAASSGLKAILVSGAKGMLVGAAVATVVVAGPRLVGSHAKDSERPAASSIAAIPPVTARPSPVLEQPSASAAPALSFEGALPPPPPPVEDPAEEEAEPVPAPVPEAVTAPPSAAAASSPFAPDRAPAVVAPPEAVTAPAPTDSTTPVAGSTKHLSDELRAFEKAHMAFSKGDVWTAANALDEYDREYPHGSLALEAEVMRIEILGAKNQTAALKKRAQAFLDANPAAPEARRVRNLLERAGGSTTR